MDIQSKFNMSRGHDNTLYIVNNESDKKEYICFINSE